MKEGFMAGPMPPQGAPQGAPPQPGQASQQQQGGSDPQAALKMIQMGFQQLGKMMQSAGQQVDPQDVKLFQQALSATDAFIQSITGPADSQGGQPRAQQSGPMPANANANAKQAM